MYCTYMTHYTGDKLPPYYIGSTSINRVENGYHGSPGSKNFKSIWANELKDNPHLFKTTILNRHTTRDEAYLDEIKWQTKLNVVENDLFVNAKIQPSTFTTQGKTKILSEETKTKLSKVGKGRKRSEKTNEKIKKFWQENPYPEEAKEKISKSKIGKPRSEETKAKLSKANTGKKHSEETKAKMKGRTSSTKGKTWYHNPITKERKLFIEDEQEYGFIKGMKGK